MVSYHSETVTYIVVKIIFHYQHKLANCAYPSGYLTKKGLISPQTDKTESFSKQIKLFMNRIWF